MLFLKVLAFKRIQKAVQDSSYLCLILEIQNAVGVVLCYIALSCLCDCVIST